MAFKPFGFRMGLASMIINEHLFSNHFECRAKTGYLRTT